MKIIDHRSPSITEFSNIKINEGFVFDNHIYIKIDTNDAYCASQHFEQKYFSLKEKVEPVDLELIVHTKS